VAHFYYPSNLGDWDWEDQVSRPTWTHSLQDPISKTTRAKCTGGVAQVAEYLLCKCEGLSSNPIPPPSKKKIRTWVALNGTGL
jgi:hypothetical protein